MRRILIELPSIGLRVPSFGLMLLLACAAALWITAWRARRERLEANAVFDLSVWLMSGGFIGARLLFILSHPDTIHGFADMLKIWQGGIVYYGCILGGLTGSLIYWRRRPFPFLAMADAVAPALAVGCALGRVGCFLNGCCYGAVSNLPWAVSFPAGSLPWARHIQAGWIPADALSSLPVHPAQLYAVLDGLVLLALLTAFYPRRRRDGEVMALLMVTYPVTRFCIEALRDDESAVGLGLSMSQHISVGIFLAGLAAWAILSRRPRIRHADGVAPSPPSATRTRTQTRERELLASR